MPPGFGHERLKRRVRRRIKERPNNADLAQIVAKNRRALLRADLANLDLLAAPTPTQRRPPRRSATRRLSLGDESLLEDVDGSGDDHDCE
jgi:hypothetical protein